MTSIHVSPECRRLRHRIGLKQVILAHNKPHQKMKTNFGCKVDTSVDRHVLLMLAQLHTYLDAFQL